MLNWQLGIVYVAPCFFSLGMAAPSVLNNSLLSHYLYTHARTYAQAHTHIHADELNQFSCWEQKYFGFS